MITNFKSLLLQNFTIKIDYFIGKFHNLIAVNFLIKLTLYLAIVETCRLIIKEAFNLENLFERNIKINQNTKHYLLSRSHSHDFLMYTDAKVHC